MMSADDFGRRVTLGEGGSPEAWERKGTRVGGIKRVQFLSLFFVFFFLLSPSLCLCSGSSSGEK